MASVVMMVGTADYDLMAFANQISASGPNKITISQSTSSEPSISSRAMSTLKNIQGGESLYVVAHGNGPSWGSASANAVTVDAGRMIDILHVNLQKNVLVYLCICESWASGVALKGKRPDLEVWAARRTPKLAWNSTSRTVDDSSGNFRKV